MPPTTDWRWYLCRASDMAQIAELKAYSRQLTLQLNSQGKASCWLDLLDPVTTSVVVHQTALRLDRDGVTVWSGPIWQADESSTAGTGNQSGQDTLQVTAMGWLQTLNRRLLHTGAEFAAMLAAPNGVAWQAANGAYAGIGTDTAIQLAYSASQNPATTDAAIIFDLLARANIDSPTGITAGDVYGTAQQRNLTLQRFQGVGAQITTLCNVEAGVDLYIDPVTRKMHLFGLGASSSPSIQNGMGSARPGALLTYPGNCTSAKRTQDGTATTNRVEALGQYAVGRADDPPSQALNGLLEDQASLSEVVDPSILIAYAQVEIVVKSSPWTIISLTPRGLAPVDAKTPGVPRPFVDYNVGDVVYCTIRRGPRMQVGVGMPQPTRVFGMTVNISDDGVERVSNIQTTYQGLS
jgi:hypothetical protein